MSPKDSMKEATFNAEDLGLDGEITSIRVSEDNTITVCYHDAWESMLQEVTDEIYEGEIINAEKNVSDGSVGFFDLQLEETDFKVGNWGLTEYSIETIAHFKDDDELHGILRVWVSRKA